jgi:hypothetical protein
MSLPRRRCRATSDKFRISPPEGEAPAPVCGYNAPPRLPSRSGGMAYAGDSKSPAPRGREGSTPSSGTITVAFACDGICALRRTGDRLGRMRPRSLAWPRRCVPAPASRTSSARLLRGDFSRCEQNDLPHKESSFAALVPEFAAREVSRGNRGRRRAPREAERSERTSRTIEAASGRVVRRWRQPGPE